MIIKNSLIDEICNSEALTKLTESPLISAKTTFDLAKFMLEYTPICKLLLEKKQNLINKYCDKDEGGNPIQENGRVFFNKNYNEFLDEFNELMNADTEFSREKKIEISLKSLPDNTFNTMEVMKLMELIDFVD